MSGRRLAAERVDHVFGEEQRLGRDDVADAVGRLNRERAVSAVKVGAEGRQGIGAEDDIKVEVAHNHEGPLERDRTDLEDRRGAASDGEGLAISAHEVDV